MQPGPRRGNKPFPFTQQSAAALAHLPMEQHPCHLALIPAPPLTYHVTPTKPLTVILLNPFTARIILIFYPDYLVIAYSQFEAELQTMERLLG